MNICYMAGQSKYAGDRALECILEMRSDITDIKEKLKELQCDHDKIDDKDEISWSASYDAISSLQDNLTSTQRKLRNMEKSLGITARQKLAKLKGDEFLRCRVNAHALKIRIRARLVAHKFERKKLEWAYKHQVMRKNN